jgi:hypothetical protein
VRVMVEGADLQRVQEHAQHIADTLRSVLGE